MMYTKLINKLINIEKEAKKIQSKDTRIKKSLLSLCQETFKEFRYSPEYKKDDDESFEKYTAYKKKIMGNMILIAHIYLTVKIFKLTTLNHIVNGFYKIMRETESINVWSNCYEGLCSLFTIIGSKTDPDFGEEVKMNLAFNLTWSENTNLIINGKIKGMQIEGCKNCAIIVEEVVTAIELMNCEGVKIQIAKKVNQVIVDKS